MWYPSTALEVPAWFRPLNLEMRKILIISCTTRMQLKRPEVVTQYSPRSAMDKCFHHCSTVSGETFNSSMSYFLQENISCWHFKQSND